jgi:hypothetical protein
VQYRINLEAAHWRARKLNEILPAVQDKFEQSLSAGVLLELETGFGDTLDELLEAAFADS